VSNFSPLLSFSGAELPEPLNRGCVPFGTTPTDHMLLAGRESDETITVVFGQGDTRIFERRHRGLSWRREVAIGSAAQADQ